MSSGDEEVVVLEKVALRQRIANTAQRGFLVLTNKRLIFQPKLTLVGSAFFWGGFFIFLVSFVIFCLPFIALLFSEGFTSTVQLGLLLGIPFMGIGLSMIGVAYRKRNPKEVVMEFKDIVDVGEAGLGGIGSATFGGRQEKLWIKLRDARKMDPSIRGQVYETDDGRYEERFAMWKRDEFLDEVRFAMRGGPVEVPSSLVAIEELNVPKYTVPQKYPGALVRLQKTYLTPKICCMCGEPAPEKTIIANLSTSKRIKEGNALAGPLANASTPFNHPFPICAGCFKVHRRANIAGSLGGIIGLFLGGAIFALFFFSGYFFSTLGFIAEAFSSFGSLGEISALLFSFFLIVLFTAGLGWMTGKTLASEAFALRQVPKEKRAFFRVVAENKGLRVTRRPGFVAFGFLSKDFATVFGQMNGGVATVVENAEEKKKIRNNKS